MPRFPAVFHCMLTLAALGLAACSHEVAPKAKPAEAPKAEAQAPAA